MSEISKVEELVADTTENNSGKGSSKKFFRNSINIANEKGSLDQKVDMAGVIAETSKNLGELEDILSGKRNQEDHLHHPVDDLITASIGGIKEIIKMRNEIKNS